MDVAATADGRASHEQDTQDSQKGESILSGLHDGDSKYQKAIAAWRNIDLTNLVPTLDTAASDIVTHQRDSLVQRKELAQKTKEFRKLDDATKLAEYKGLLKAYQSFIDLLTNHSKSTSSAFLQVYSSISEAPDPYPLLEASVDSLVLSEDTVPKLTAENEHLQSTVSSLTTHLEDTEKRLQEERKTRKSLEEAQDSKAKEIEASWSAVLEEKKDNWEAKERSLEEKVENQERLLKEIKASYEVSQRLDRAEDAEGDAPRGSASIAELEIVSSDLERTSVRLAEVEARNEQLRMELAQSASQTQASQAPSSVEDDPTFLRIQSEYSTLLRKVEATRFERDSERRGWESKLRSVERELASLKQDRDLLKERVSKWSDYEDVKRELEVLKSIEFATGDDDETGETDLETSPDRSAQKSKGDTLEQLLLARNKKLGNELTILRVSHQDLQSRLESLQEDLSETNAELERSRNLTASLENDLERVQREAANAFPSSALSVAGTYSSRYPQSTAHGAGSMAGRRGRASSPTSSIISGFAPRNHSPNSLDAIRAGEPVGGGSGILPMVTAQRDRFKQRNSQLEEELSKAYTTVSSLRQEVASLQKDNLDLYEKTRYVSTYNRGGGGGGGLQTTAASSSAYASSNPNPSRIHVSDATPSGLSLDQRYRSAYEANISPFAAFRGRESARAYKRMSLPERVIFSFTRMVLANRTSRNLFAAYCLALHVLVLGMLYWMSSTDIERHVVGGGGGGGLGDSAAAAVVAAAGGGGSLGDGGGAGAGAGSAGLGASHGDWQQEGFSEGG
ncbi:MAG: hypothetical protein M1819_005275 [Sarea resinae]|nr:MAG: hypothetical protein M1819_005275 [Sarea resinae]